MVNIEVHSPKDTSSATAMGFVGLLLNKIPDWLKFGFTLGFALILVLKLLGFSLYTDFDLNTYNFKLLVLRYVH